MPAKSFYAVAGIVFLPILLYPPAGKVAAAGAGVLFSILMNLGIPLLLLGPIWVYTTVWRAPPRAITALEFWSTATLILAVAIALHPFSFARAMTPMFHADPLD